MLHGKHMPSGQGHTVRYDMFCTVSSTQPNIRVGDIFYTQLLGKDIIIINSEKIAKDLLGNRSRNYSDRPPLVAVEMFVPCFLSYC